MFHKLFLLLINFPIHQSLNIKETGKQAKEGNVWTREIYQNKKLINSLKSYGKITTNTKLFNTFFLFFLFNFMLNP